MRGGRPCSETNAGRTRGRIAEPSGISSYLGGTCIAICITWLTIELVESPPRLLDLVVGEVDGFIGIDDLGLTI